MRYDGEREIGPRRTPRHSSSLFTLVEDNVVSQDQGEGKSLNRIETSD